MQLKRVIIIGIVGYFVWTLCEFVKESFHSGLGPYACGKASSKWWNPQNNPYKIHPYTHVLHPYGLDPSEEVQGDLTLTNMYRKLHNIEGVNRVGVFEHSHIKTPGGGGGIQRQFYIGEALDREAKRIQKNIRDEIGFRRIPYSDAYPENTALGGNFYDCHIGDCQWSQDNEGKILGIPSVPGVRHPYY